MAAKKLTEEEIQKRIKEQLDWLRSHSWCTESDYYIENAILQEWAEKERNKADDPIEDPPKEKD